MSLPVRNRLLGVFPVLMLALTCASGLRAQTAEQPGAANAPTAAHSAELAGVWTQYPRITGRSGYAVFSFGKEEPPMTSWAEAKYKAAKAVHVGGYSGESDDTTLTCFPPGVPRIYLFNFPMEIIQLPGRVILFHEFGHFVRQIYTDGREHPQDVIPTWMGDSIGHWEGDVLVVDTIGFNDKTWLDQLGHPHSDALHLVERIRRADHDTLQIDFTFDDPKAFTKPWSAQKLFKLKPSWEIKEYVCEDNFSNKEIMEISK